MATFGHDDPAISPALRRLHDEAEARGEAMYLDPNLGLWVQTSATLAKNGKCCGRTCRHCPYGPTEQERSGRAIVRPRHEGS